MCRIPCLTFLVLAQSFLPFHLTGAHDNFLSRTSWPARSSTIDFFFGLSLPRGSMGQPGRHPRQVWRQVSPPFAPSLVHPALTCAARHAAELKPTHRIPLTPSPPWPSGTDSKSHRGGFSTGACRRVASNSTYERSRSAQGRWGSLRQRGFRPAHLQ